METLKLSQHAVLRQETFGGLLFDRATWHIRELNPTAYELLSELEQNPCTLSDFIALAKARYGDISVAEQQEIEAFLRSCQKLGLLACEESGLEEKGTWACDHHTMRKSATYQTPSSITRHLSAPISCWWDITAICNLKCKQCYSSSGKKLRDELSSDEVYKILGMMAAMKVFFVYFLGGEPLLREDFLDILARCRDLGLEVMMGTNGWFVTPEIAKQLSNLGVRHVRVSIDGATSEVHDSIRGRIGSFNKAVSAVHYLKEAGIPLVGVSPTIMAENFHEAEAMIDRAFKLGANEIQLGQICEVGRASDQGALNADQINNLRGLLLRKRKEYNSQFLISGSEGIYHEKPYYRRVLNGELMPTIMGCGAGRSVLAIGPSGKVRACLLYKYEIGDLRTHTLEELWEGEGFENLSLLRSVKSGCEGCNYSAVCSGPCPMEEIVSEEERKCFVSRKELSDVRV